ncbi:hypothetical protein BFL34_00371 [Clavibacter michiganensis]|uniref:Uncharacterized protein n=1 Tax=Clavibacter michiganensis TaxID=28447 RepID=A0A251YCB3_9MICO|nr:hypothetical protein BFL34_00371 [Clavibacter michiganensis]
MVDRSHPRRRVRATRPRGARPGSDAAQAERTDQPFGQELYDALMGPTAFGAGQMNFA